MSTVENRRRHERFALRPMYTPITVVPSGVDSCPLEGHAYDIGEGGVRFEIDSPLPPGTHAEVVITLPGAAGLAGPIAAAGNIVWLTEDPDEPGPVRMALAFNRFSAPADKARLLAHLTSGRYRRAA